MVCVSGFFHKVDYLLFIDPNSLPFEWGPLVFPIRTFEIMSESSPVYTLFFGFDGGSSPFPFSQCRRDYQGSPVLAAALRGYPSPPFFFGFRQDTS